MNEWIRVVIILNFVLNFYITLASFNYFFIFGNLFNIQIYRVLLNIFKRINFWVKQYFFYSLSIESIYSNSNSTVYLIKISLWLFLFEYFNEQIISIPIKKDDLLRFTVQVGTRVIERKSNLKSIYPMSNIVWYFPENLSFFPEENISTIVALQQQCCYCVLIFSSRSLHFSFAFFCYFSWFRDLYMPLNTRAIATSQI